MSNHASPNPDDILIAWRQRPSEEEVRAFFAPVLDDEPTSEPDEPSSPRSALSEATAESRWNSHC